MFLLKLPVRFDTVFADPEDDRVFPLELFHVVSELLSFGCTSRRAILWIEVQNYLLAFVVAQRYFASIISLQCKVWSSFSLTSQLQSPHSESSMYASVLKQYRVFYFLVVNFAPHACMRTLPA